MNDSVTIPDRITCLMFPYLTRSYKNDTVTTSIPNRTNRYWYLN